MKKSFFIFVLFVISATLIAQPVGRMNRNAEKSGCKILDKLNLTPEQEKQFRDITFEHQKKVIDLKSQIEKNRLEIRKMAADNKVDEKKLIDITDANSKLQADIKSSSVRRWIAINNILSEEQKAIWSKHLGVMDKYGRMFSMIKDHIKERVKNRMR
ncbi:MAG: periplasmic heavy metal sensor [Bacteroidota bacterium]